MAKFIVCVFIVCSLYNSAVFSVLGKEKVYPSDSTTREAPLAITFNVKFHSSNGIDQNILEVPFRLSGNLIMVEAEINEKKGFFILDSGAPELIVNSKYLSKSRFSTKKGKSAGGITGNITDVKLQLINHFKWQEYELHKTRVKAIDLSHIEQVRNEEILGLIGFELFKKFEILFDFNISRLFLYKLDKSGNKLSPLPEKQKFDHKASFVMDRHIPVLKMDFGDKKLNFGLDTGAEMNILDIRSKKKVLKYFKIKKRGLLHGNGKTKIEVLMGEITGMKLNGLSFPKTRAILADLKHINKVYNANLNGILGYHFLIHFKTSINFVKKEIYFWKPKTVSTQK